MKTIDSKAYEEITTWIYRNARPIDLAMWQFYYENGSKEAVIEKLKLYQNKDGGFGHGLEPDCWNTESSPYETMIAIGILRDIDAMDGNSKMVKEAFHFLEETDHCSSNGWFFCIPSNDQFPRAPWWTYSEKSNEVQTMGITAALCSSILRYGDRSSKVFLKASEYVDKILEQLRNTEEYGEMGVGSLGLMAADIEAAGLSKRFDCSGIIKKLPKLINSSMERDSEKWKLYTPRPSEFIPGPQSPFYPGNEEIIEKELDFLIETRNPGGVWNITWSWFDLGEKYQKEFAISENWWKTYKAIQYLKFLKSFGRLSLI